MHASSLRGGRRPIAAALLAATVAAGSLGVATPAVAAGPPTISAPAWRTGFGPITISGTATPGTRLTLIEGAYGFGAGEMYRAPNYDTANPTDVIQTVASSTGHYSFERNLDSGFLFAVEDSARQRSRVITASIRVMPWTTVSAAVDGTMTIEVTADPDEPGLPVTVQAAGASDTAPPLASGVTGEGGVFPAVLTGQGTATRQYLIHVSGDPQNAVLENSTTIDGNGDVVVPPLTTPTPAPVAVEPGDIQFTKIVYNPPGTDTGSNTSLNGEYVRLTNKTTRTIDLKNWTIRDAAGHIYRIPSTHLLRAGQTLYLHTGKGTDGRPDSAHRYWNRTGYIWNNGGDTAILRTSSNRTIDSCKWGAGSGTAYC
jgi:hypothetical protein